VPRAPAEASQQGLGGQPARGVQAGGLDQQITRPGRDRQGQSRQHRQGSRRRWRSCRSSRNQDSDQLSVAAQPRSLGRSHAGHARHPTRRPRDTGHNLTRAWLPPRRRGPAPGFSGVCWVPDPPWWNLARSVGFHQDRCPRIRPHGPSTLARCECACNRNYLAHKGSVNVAVGESGGDARSVDGSSLRESRRVQPHGRRAEPRRVVPGAWKRRPSHSRSHNVTRRGRRPLPVAPRSSLVATRMAARSSARRRSHLDSHSQAQRHAPADRSQRLPHPLGSSARRACTAQGGSC
jgi:hypothetical protein